jgi:FixJ family two-component response regulator
MVIFNRVVVVVDDDKSVCRALKRLLQSVGLDVETFSSGKELLNALSLAASYRPACVILDFQMQGINGLELLRHLAPTGVPVIFVTADDDPAVREVALASGAADYLQKPFNGATLVTAVERVLNGMQRP